MHAAHALQTRHALLELLGFHLHAPQQQADLAVILAAKAAQFDHLLSELAPAVTQMILKAGLDGLVHLQHGFGEHMPPGAAAAESPMPPPGPAIG